MGRKAKTEEIEKKECIECKKFKPIKRFYNSNNKMFQGKAPICNDCIQEKANYNNMESIYDILKLLDIPFDITYWEKAVEKDGNIIGNYIRMINSLRQMSGLTWKNSRFENKKDNREIDLYQEENISVIKNDENYDLNYLKKKYGIGYPDEEYYLFEDKYQQLKSSFQLLTTMHEEYFREFCVNKVKETLAKAQGNFKEAKEWASMVKDVAEAGKLKPSQMSKADLSGGLDTFGQLARMVEENHEIMGLLPQFIEQPKDKVDVTLWCLINYVRDLKGLPECEYKEIYEFYEHKRLEYENQMSDNLKVKDKEVDVNA